jgi:hypothetical protein
LEQLCLPDAWIAPQDHGPAFTGMDVAKEAVESPPLAMTVQQHVAPR